MNMKIIIENDMKSSKLGWNLNKLKWSEKIELKTGAERCTYEDEPSTEQTDKRSGGRSVGWWQKKKKYILKKKKK